MKILVILQCPSYGTESAYNGITEDMLIPDAHRSNLDGVTDWVLWADKTITF